MIADRTTRLGRISRAQSPVTMRSVVLRFGPRWRDRLVIRSCCLIRRDSAMIDRAPPGLSNLTAVVIRCRNRIARIAHGFRIVAARSVLTRLCFKANFGYEVLIRHPQVVARNTSAVMAHPGRCTEIGFCILVRRTRRTIIQEGQLSHADILYDHRLSRQSPSQYQIPRCR